MSTASLSVVGKVCGGENEVLWHSCACLGKRMQVYHCHSGVLTVVAEPNFSQAHPQEKPEQMRPNEEVDNASRRGVVRGRRLGALSHA